MAEKQNTTSKMDENKSDKFKPDFENYHKENEGKFFFNKKYSVFWPILCWKAHNDKMNRHKKTKDCFRLRLEILLTALVEQSIFIAIFIQSRAEYSWEESKNCFVLFK